MKHLLIACMLVLAGCVEGEEAFQPTLERSVFKEALKESLILEARANKERVVLNQTDVPLDSYYTEMFAKLGITKEQFKTTFNEFSDHPQAFEVLYEEVAEELQMELATMNELLGK